MFQFKVPVKIGSVQITNRNIAGRELVQIYSSKSNSLINRPTKELKDFTKTKLLKSGEIFRVQFNLPISDLDIGMKKEINGLLKKGIMKFSLNLRNLITDFVQKF